MFSITKAIKKDNVILTKFLADYTSDIENLPTSTNRGKQGETTAKENAMCFAGSICRICEDGSIWILNNQDEWIEQPQSSSDSDDSFTEITADEVSAMLE